MRLRRQAADLVRKVRRSSMKRLRRRIAGRAPGDPWVFRLEMVARKVTRSLRRLERALLPPAVVHTTAVASSARPVDVTAPIALIAQMGRSGGTLLTGLLDGHPQLYVVPHELSTMVPMRPIPHDPDRAFAALTPRRLYKWSADGATVGKQGLSGRKRQAVAFDLSPQVLHAEFVRRLQASPARTDREVLDAYLSAYFSAWSNGPVAAAPRWVVGFEPGAIGDQTRMAWFDANYPDGKVICVLRDPWSWFVSARRWSIRFAQPDVALNRWRHAADSALVAFARRPDRVCLLAFDRLILDTRTAVEGVCAFLGIDFDESLLTPTLNGLPIEDNSSFSSNAGGVFTAPATSRRELLSDAETLVVEERAGETWRRVLEVVGP